MNNYLEDMQELEAKYNESKSYLDKKKFMQQIKRLEAEINLNYNNKNNGKKEENHS